MNRSLLVHFFMVLSFRKKTPVIVTHGNTSTKQNIMNIFGPKQVSISKCVVQFPGGGGSHIDMVYVYVPAFWGAFSWNLV